ncbi:MAG: hypothetical protein RQM90_00115 [Methanoculleus sp.]
MSTAPRRCGGEVVALPGQPQDPGLRTGARALGDAAFKDGGEGVVYLIEYAVGDLVCSVDGLVNGVGPIQEEGAFPDLVLERLKVL